MTEPAAVVAAAGAPQVSEMSQTMISADDDVAALRSWAAISAVAAAQVIWCAALVWAAVSLAGPPHGPAHLMAALGLLPLAFLPVIVGAICWEMRRD